MRILLTAIGKMNPKSPEYALMQEYSKRLSWKLEVRECELRKNVSDSVRKAEETALLWEASQGEEKRIALDEKGKTLSSQEFADAIKAWQNQGVSSLAFIIGGADGLDKERLKSADMLLSFGRMTMPHMLVRALLAEQLYRAQTIISGHPYHRE